jgi:ubiquinone/menaquinone biosynthesis C-methylase UbiE
MTLLSALGVVLAAVVVICIVWRYAQWPCPSWLVPLLENPYFQAVASAHLLLQRADVRPGMRVLDAGCGPGRLTLPTADRVGASGHVTALDLQAGMLAKLRGRLTERGIGNVALVHAGLGSGALPRAEFDVAFLVTVLGEIPDQLAALREIHAALRPGGVLSITEVLPDPHYQSIARVRQLASQSGFREQRLFPGWVSFTINLVRPADEPTAVGQPVVA